MCTVNRQKLIEDNINLVYFVIHTYYPTFIYDEDLIQCGMFGLCRAGNAWDEEKGAFSNFAIHCIRNEIYREFYNRKRHKSTLSLEHEYRDRSDDTMTLAESLVGEADIDWVDVEGIRSKLDEVDQKILDCKLSGMSTAEIAKRLGYSRQNITRRIRQMRLSMEDI